MNYIDEAIVEVQKHLPIQVNRRHRKARLFSPKERYYYWEHCFRNASVGVSVKQAKICRNALEIVKGKQTVVDQLFSKIENSLGSSVII